MADDEYEYLYDTNETSTFLVELDLSTLNGIKRDMPRQYHKRRKYARSGADEDDEDGDGGVEDQADPDQTAPAAEASRPTRAKNDIQILEANSLNPIVSYKGNFYSCTWQDLIGTNMFYSLPHQGIEHVPLRSTRDYDLLGTSRVKLVGQRAKVSEKAASRKRQRVGTEAASKQNESTPPGSGTRQSETEAGTVKSDSMPVETQEQTAFLDKLMAIQSSRQRRTGNNVVEHQALADASGSDPSDQVQARHAIEEAVS
jgi:hypothetical protein